MRVAAACVCAFATSPAVAAEWMMGPWCDETGWDRVTIAEHALFPDVQTACPLAAPFPEDGVIVAKLQCETTLFHGPEPGDMIHVNVLMGIELRPVGEGVMQMRIDGAAPFELVQCQTVWPE